MDAPSSRHDSQRTATILQQAAVEGQSALEALLPIVYDELRRLAAAHLRRERMDHTLQPTALANEAYLRLVGESGGQVTGRAHFLGVAARAMRRILVEHARARGAKKRGGDRTRVPLVDALEDFHVPDLDLLELEDALVELESASPRQARVVTLRFFGGLSVEAVAEALDQGRTTTADDWYMARAWLRCRLGEASADA